MSMSLALSEYLNDHQVNYELIEHRHTDSSLSTAQAAHVNPDKVAKAVVVKHGNHFVMCVIPASHQLILEWLEYEQQQSFTLANERELMQLFPDCEVGAVPCVGQVFNLDVIMDTALSDCQDIYIEAGDHTHLVHLNKEQFTEVMDDAWQAVISCPVKENFSSSWH